MKALILLNESEKNQLQPINVALEGLDVIKEILIFKPPFEHKCSQIEEIKKLLPPNDAIVYFASLENEKNICLDLALSEAARLDKKVICIWLDEKAIINNSFEGLGDCLISSISKLPEAIAGKNLEWQNTDGTLRNDRPFKRYKCGAK